MLDLFKKEINIKDKVKLFLTTGKEPEGEVVEIGENYVLLRVGDDSQHRYFEKIIGGWDIINKDLIIEPNESKAIKISNVEVSKSNEPKLEQNSNIEVSELNESTFEPTFNKKWVIEGVNKLLVDKSITTLDSIIEANATIYKTGKDWCWAKNDDYPKIFILNERLLSDKLVKATSSLKKGESIPILISLKGVKNEKAVSIVVLKPQSARSILITVKLFVEKDYFELAYRVFSVLKFSTEVSARVQKYFNEFKKLNFEILTEKEKMYLINQDTKKSNDNGDNEEFRGIEVLINKIIQDKDYDRALLEIDKCLTMNLPAKYMSSFLLKKAQLFSSINMPQESEDSYRDLINFNEKNKASSNNLSHLYTELGRLQAINPLKSSVAIESLRKAIKLNPQNGFAESLFNKLSKQRVTGKSPIESEEKIFDHSVEEFLMIDYSEEQNTISDLISIDLKEHKFTNSEILNNDGIPTALIAKKILNQAKNKREGDLSDRYPIYLEAAKAYSKLNIGSYDSNEYYEAVAYYSMLKGDSLFIKFRNTVLNKEFDKKLITKLKDSACSYFIEALNLFSNIKPDYLLEILKNYMKINIVHHFASVNENEEFGALFKGQFSDTLTFCIRNENKAIEKIAYKAIIDCGASSINAWNKLTKLPKGTKSLYGEFSNVKERNRIYHIIEEIEGLDIDKSINPGAFLKTVFISRREKLRRFKENFSTLQNIEFIPANFHEIKKCWEELNEFNQLLLDTDTEIKEVIDRVIILLQPYLNRSEAERINIFIQARQAIERVLELIRQHTTYFGRVVYFDLLNSWKTKIDWLLQEKVSTSNPILEILIDPPYILRQESKHIIPVIIRNIGVSTANGYKLDTRLEAIEFNLVESSSLNSTSEVPASGQVKITIDVPERLFEESSAVEARFDIKPIFQAQELPLSSYNFTIELEQKSYLEYDGIPWKDGPIPSEHMFKGRKKLIIDLAEHYLSVNRDKPYILFGLTRTGKSSILKYLAEQLKHQKVKLNGVEKEILVFEWDLSLAASQTNASDFYDYILFQNCYEELSKYFLERDEKVPHYDFRDRVKFKDFKGLLDLMSETGFFPIFFIDEFSFMKTLIDRGVITSAFLHSIRQYSLNSQASFVFAGTYDIKDLIKNPKYGITGQLVNTIEEQVNEIKPKYAEELIRVIEDELTFTVEAVEHIKYLSGNIPYFIQMICKNCGYFAVENQRKYIGYPELESVIEILTGERLESEKSLIKKLPEGAFQNNQFNPQDPKEIPCLISTIAFINRERIKSRGVSLAELEALWGKMELVAFRPRLSDAIMALKERRILRQTQDESMPVYSLPVDLFRRWWAVHHPDIVLELNTLKEK